MNVHKHYVSYLRGGGKLKWLDFVDIHGGAKKKEVQKSPGNVSKSEMQKSLREMRSMKAKLPVPANQRCSICTEMLNFMYVTNHCRSLAERSEYVPEAPVVPNDCNKPGKQRQGVTTPCRHCFHRCCLRQWLQISNSCPICKTVFTEDFFKRVQGEVPLPQPVFSGPINFIYSFDQRKNAALSYASGLPDVSEDVVPVEPPNVWYIRNEIKHEFGRILNLLHMESDLGRIHELFQWIRGYFTIHGQARILGWQNQEDIVIFLNVLFTYVKKDGTIRRPNTYFQNNFKEAFLLGAKSFAKFFDVFPYLEEEYGSGQFYNTLENTNLADKIEISPGQINSFNERIAIVENNTDYYNININFDETKAFQLQMLREVLQRLPEDSRDGFKTIVKGMCLGAFKSKTFTLAVIESFKYYGGQLTDFYIVIAQCMYNLGEYFMGNEL